MANLVIPRREILSGQPSNLPPIIHPGFSKKDSFVYAPWISPNTIVRLGGSKISMTTRGDPQPVSSRLRLAAKFVASNNDCITNQGFAQLLALPTITIAIASTGAITGAIRSIIGRSNYGNRYIGIRAGSASNTWEYQYYGSSSSVVLTGTSSFSDDEMCVIAGVSYSATDHELYVNGKLEATSTTNGGADPGFDSLVVGCANDSRVWDLRANGLIGLGLIGQGVLSRPSVRQLAENPWQIFAPRETRLFVPVGGGGSTSLIIADALHGHATDSPSFSMATYLAVAESLHAHTADNLTLSATGAASLVVQESTHAHIADGIALTTNWLLSIAESLHGHAADGLSLTSQAYLAVSEALHGHTADTLTLDTSNATFLTVQDSAHSHSADSLGFSLDTWLAIVDAAHAHTADAPTLSASVALLIAEALHAQYADVAVLSLPGETTLTPEDIAAIAAAVLAALNATTIPVDAVKLNGASVIGTGTLGDDWRGVGVPPQ